MHREHRPEERKRLVAGAITGAVIGLLLWSSLRGGAPPPADPGVLAPGPAPTPEPPSPFAAAEARLRELLDSGLRGDVQGYLTAFSGALRDRLEREARERGRDGFADHLRRAAEARKGHAIFAPEPDGPDACRIVVESVYPDRNERQTYRLVHTPSGWLVAEVDSVRSRSPAEKYGSPSGFVGSEGLPGAVTEQGPE